MSYNNIFLTYTYDENVKNLIEKSWVRVLILAYHLSGLLFYPDNIYILQTINTNN
jgi:hypothetical protein